MQPGAAIDQIWVATTIEVSRIDPLLADGCGQPSFFWFDPSRELCAMGFGVAAECTPEAQGIEAAYAAIASPLPFEQRGRPAPGPWFGGVAFDPSRHSAEGGWEGFPRARWVLPEVLVWTERDQSFVTTYARGHEHAPVALWSRELEPQPARQLSLSADRPGWDRLIADCLGAIEKGELKKVVAARPIEVALDAEAPVRELLAELRAKAPRCTTFMLASADGKSAFVGATPERLCRIDGRTIETEALASSAKPSERDTLARGDKERREHRAVIDGLEAALSPLCESLQVGAEPRLLELPYVSHLWTPLQGRLREGVGAGQALAAIYPTAAVGGTPRGDALAFISRHEGWNRGWYAGAIGWAGPSGVDLKVAIRSARVRGDRATVFVGAGIVSGSVAEKEWVETETKAGPMLRALAGGAK